MKPISTTSGRRMFPRPSFLRVFPMALAVAAVAFYQDAARAVIISSGDVKPPFNLPDLPGPRTFTVPTGGSTGGGVYVGDLNPGTLTINNGWTLNSTFVTIAFQPTSSASSVTISDGSVWNSTGFNIGEGAIGHLNVLTNSTVSATFMVLGSQAGANGQAIFTSSTLNTNGGALIAGLNGAGNLQLQGTTTNAGYVEIGRFGYGVLGVNSGGSLTIPATGTLLFATELSSSAYGAISGPTVVTNHGFFEAGRNGNADVVIGGGASVSTDGFALIATGTNSVSTLDVSGTGTAFTTASSFEVGRDGDATLTISAGATVGSGFASIGGGANSLSSATVTGAGSIWTNVGGLFIAANGRGTLLVENGGAINTGFIVLAGESTGFAQATVRGAGSTWTGTSVDVGYRGHGEMFVENGATVSSTFVRIAGDTGGNGALTIRSGAAWTSSSTIDVGSKGIGTLTLESGATISSPYVRLGGEAAGVGTVGIHGTGTAWTAQGIDVGSFGSGTFLLDGGATFTNSEFFVVAAAGGTGAVTIAGNGTSFTSLRQLLAGSEGTGTLTVSDGALLTTFKATSPTNSSGIIGRRSGQDGFIRGAGTMTVTGANSRYIGDGVFNVGFDGDGTLNITAGGRVESTDGVIARNATSTGQTTISGSGSAWVMANGLALGSSGPGVLTMNGGLLTAAQITVGVTATGSGTLALNGGVIQTAYLAKGAGAATLNFNGGTLRATQNETDFIRTAGFNTANTQIQSGGLTIDTNGRTVGLRNPMDGPGALTKIGAGTLELNTNTQTFATLNASAGTTNVNVPLGTGGTAVNVAGSLNFGADQTLASLSIGNGGVVSFTSPPAPEFVGSAAPIPEPNGVRLLACCGVGWLAARRRVRAG